MKSSLPRKRSLRILTLLTLTAVVLGIGYLGARHIAWPAFKSWREDRANNVAREYLAKGDYVNALLAVRKTLGYNQFNTEAWKLAVEITEKQNTPEVIYYQQRLAAIQPTLENKLKHMRLAVKYKAFANALQTIKGAGPEVTKSPEFYELAATVAQRTNNAAQAKYYLMSLVALQPDNHRARLDLAHMRLVDGYEENKPAIRAEIRELASDPALRTRALSILLADSIDAQDATATLELADQIANAPDTNATTQLMIAEAYNTYAPDRAAPYLAKLEAKADTPEKITPIAAYLATHGQAAEAKRWIDSLPEELRGHEAIQVTYAAALHGLKDYATLENYLRALKWTENEHVRQLFLAYAYKSRGDVRAFSDAWKLSLIEAGNDPRKLQILLNQTNTWDWPDQKYEILWKRLMLNPADRSVRNQLAAWEYSRGNTVNLNRLFSRIAEYDPADKDARNNTNYTSLILNINTDRANRDAYDLYKTDPNNAYYVTTYALSLYKQNKPKEALDILETLGAAALATPERTLIRSVLLIAIGRTDEGVEQSANLKLDRVLPEERRLYTETASTIAQARRAQANAARLAALAGGTGLNANGVERKSWLAPLPASLREKPSVQMELADTLYATDDYANLAETLRADPWPENDYLRQALLAYAQRNLNREGVARDTWRLALISAGNRSDNLSILEDLSERWGWTIERIDVLNRIVQRDPGNEKSFGELAEHYTKYGQTSELVRIYALRAEGDNPNAESKTRFAYYSLLTNTNLARAHVLAKEAYDALPSDVFSAKVYAFSLLKQSRVADGWKIIEKLPDHPETGLAQLSLLKAVLAAQRNDKLQALAQLGTFDSKTALPEEIALADNLSKSLATKGNI